MDQEDFVETYGFSTDDLNQLLERKQYRQLREKVNDLNEADTAEYLEELPDEKRLLVFRMLQKDKASDVFAFLPPDIQKIIIDSFTDTELRNIVEDLYVDDAVDMLEELPASVVRRVLKNAPHHAEEHTSELQSQFHLVCRLLLEKKNVLLHLPRLQLETLQLGHRNLDRHILLRFIRIHIRFLRTDLVPDFLVIAHTAVPMLQILIA